MNKIILVVIFSIFSSGFIFGQEKGGDKPFNPDSVIVFNSPRPLINNQPQSNTGINGWGGDLLLSDSGFGFGLFFHTFLSENLIAYTSLYISGARNSDEFEEYNYYSNTWQVRNKINRIYKFPLMVGLQYFIFKDALSESLQPYLSMGLGPTFIVSAPYTYNRIPNGEIMGWFKSFSYADTYTKFGGFIGIGSYFGNLSKNVLGVNVKYYYVPFGGNGLESVIGLPIENFGGIFLSLSFGTAF